MYSKNLDYAIIFVQCSTELANFYVKQKQKTGGRTKVLLETVPIHKLADIFVASFEISFEEQLSMLDSVDLKIRLSKATELVDRHLQVFSEDDFIDKLFIPSDMHVLMLFVFE